MLEKKEMTYGIGRVTMGDFCGKICREIDDLNGFKWTSTVRILASDIVGN